MRRQASMIDWRFFCSSLADMDIPRLVALSPHHKRFLVPRQGLIIASQYSRTS
jgi:hypothetical protein